jgi:hypothetical protein
LRRCSCKRAPSYFTSKIIFFPFSFPKISSGRSTFCAFMNWYGRKSVRPARESARGPLRACDAASPMSFVIA